MKVTEGEEMSDRSILPRWLDMPTACRYMSACRKTVRRHLIRGDIRGDRLGVGDKAHWRIDRESIDAYLDPRSSNPSLNFRKSTTYPILTGLDIPGGATA